MKKSINFIVAILGCAVNLFGQIPLIPHVNSADPSGHVWPDDPETLWIYASHDIPGTDSHKTMAHYHVYSSKDLVHWTDYGRVLSVADVPWASSMAWAFDAVYRKGHYYLVHCMKDRSTGVTNVGLAVSDYPQGPFKDVGYIEGTGHGQDPALFVDDDGKPYLFWGHMMGAQLTDNLRAIKPETMVCFDEQLKDAFEGMFVFKREGKYYLTYASTVDGTYPQTLSYAMSDSPLGPYKYVGTYVTRFEGQAATNHGSVVKWKDKWIALHHGSQLSGGNMTARSVLADWLTFDVHGYINPITETKGPGFAEKSIATVFLEAENAPMQGGKLEGTYVSRVQKGFSGEGYVHGFDRMYTFVEVLVQVAKDMNADLTIRLNAEDDFRADIITGRYIYNLDQKWKGIPIDKTNGWKEVKFEGIKLDAGDNLIKFQVYKDANVSVDWFKVDNFKAKE